MSREGLRVPLAGIVAVGAFSLGGCAEPIESIFDDASPTQLTTTDQNITRATIPDTDQLHESTTELDENVITRVHVETGCKTLTAEADNTIRAVVFSGSEARGRTAPIAGNKDQSVIFCVTTGKADLVVTTTDDIDLPAISPTAIPSGSLVPSTRRSQGVTPSPSRSNKRS